MKKAFRKAISILLVAVMVFGAAPLAGFIGLELPEINLFTTKVEAATDGYYTYSVSNGEATITDVDTSISGDVVIPSTLGGYPVTSIGAYAFEDCASLTGVTIPDNVTSIGDYAFQRCKGLEKITIPDRVRMIGNHAFIGCTSLTTTYYPGIPEDWKKITIGSSNDYLTNNIIFESDSERPYPGGYCGENLIWKYYDDGKLEITGTGAMTSSPWERYRFYITSVSLPDGLTSIDAYAFANCRSLTDMTIPDSVTSIGSNAFYDTPYYNDANNWENDVLYIGNYLVEAKNSLSGSYKIKEGILMIADCAFYYNGSLTSITIPDSVTSIGGSAFENCDKLESVTIGNGVTSIGGLAFRDCNNLEKVTFGSGVKSIGTYAFTSCTSLESIILPDGLISIGKWAFMYCSSLTDITIPDSVTSIGTQAFYRCSNIKNVYYGGSKAEWEEIEIGASNDPILYHARIHYNSTESDSGSTDVPDYDSSVVDPFFVATPSEIIISYGDSIVLHVDPSKIPEGGKVEWYASNGNFTYSVSSFGTTCTITPENSGDTTFTAIVYDAQGNIVSADTQEMTSKAGFFDKLISFFKKLFGLTKTIPEAIKSI